MAGAKRDAAWWREYRRKKKEKEEGIEAKVFELQPEVALQPRLATVVQPKSATLLPVVQPTATPTQPTVITKNNVAQPSATSSKKVAQHKEPEMNATQPSTKVVQALQQGNATITQPSATNRIASYLCANPRHSLAAISIISFVLCNTAFLAFEQQKGFVTLGYSVPVAWGIAVLFELAIEILFISIALSKHSFMRIALRSY